MLFRHKIASPSETDPATEITELSETLVVLELRAKVAEARMRIAEAQTRGREAVLRLKKVEQEIAALG